MKDRSLGRLEKQERMNEIKTKYAIMLEEEQRRLDEEQQRLYEQVAETPAISNRKTMVEEDEMSEDG